MKVLERFYKERQALRIRLYQMKERAKRRRWINQQKVNRHNQEHR